MAGLLPLVGGKKYLHFVRTFFDAKVIFVLSIKPGIVTLHGCCQKFEIVV
jgi:hypothetical protein